MLLVKRTGVRLDSWVRGGAPTEVLTIMSATALESVQTIVETLGGLSPQEVLIEADQYKILFACVDYQAILVFIAPRHLRNSRLRRESQPVVTAVEKLFASREIARSPSPLRQVDESPVPQESLPARLPVIR